MVLNFVEFFTVDVVWGSWLFLLNFTIWNRSVNWLCQFVPMRSLCWLLWVRSESSGCRSFPLFESLGSLLVVCSTNVREDPCCNLFWSQSICWLLIPVLLFAVFSTTVKLYACKIYSTKLQLCRFFQWLSGEELSVSFRIFNDWYLSMLSPISFETGQLVLFPSVNVGHESCWCDIEIALRRLLSDDDSLELLEELCLLRKLYLRVFLGCIFIVPCVSVWYEGAYSVVFVKGVSPEAPSVFIFDLDKPFIIFFRFSNVGVRSPERSASVVFLLLVRVNSEILSKNLSKHALCSRRVSYVSWRTSTSSVWYCSSRNFTAEPHSTSRLMICWINVSFLLFVFGAICFCLIAVWNCSGYSCLVLNQFAVFNSFSFWAKLNSTIIESSSLVERKSIQ